LGLESGLSANFNVFYMKFIVGTKERMTQVFDAEGVAHAATILRVMPATVSQVRNLEKDGYEAVQIAAGDQKEHRVSKAAKGHLGGAKKHIKEFRPRASHKEELGTLEKGQTIDVSVFEPGDIITVSAISKGKGFQGVVKRHGFRGGPGSHGDKHMLRAPGSIGATGPQRVFKGLRMAGRMGGDLVTVENLTVLQVNKEENMLLVKGAVPGRTGTLVEVRSV
jgi:large subunit ribosomal protein L3